MSDPFQTPPPWPFSFAADGLFCTHDASFMEDPQFQRAFRMAKGTGSWGEINPFWRALVIGWAGRLALTLDGDLVECGAYRGGNAMMLLHYSGLKESSRSLHLIDTFDGIPTEYLLTQEKELGIDSVYAHYGSCLEEVRKSFAPFPQIKIHCGKIPDILPQTHISKVSFLSIDLNNVVPEIASIRYFWDKLVPGAPVVLDDYGQALHKYQKAAFDDFAAEKGIAILPLPTSQGLMIKPPN